MIRSLFSVAILLGTISLIGKVVQQTLAEDNEKKSVAAANDDTAAKSNNADSLDLEKANVEKKSLKIPTKRLGPNKVVPSIGAAFELECKSPPKEDNAGTDDAPKKDENVKEQEMPNPADVPKTAEATDDKDESPAEEKKADDKTKTDVKSATTSLNRQELLRETPLKGQLPETTYPTTTDSASKTKEPALQPVDKEDPPSLSNPEAAAPLSPELKQLHHKMRHCLQIYFHEPITTVEYSPWGIMHALIAYGVDTEIYAGERKVNAIGWLCYNGSCRGLQMMYVENGKLRLRLGPGYQGHAGQFLAMLAQSRVKKDFPIKVDGKNFTVADLIESEKETCRTRSELTFKLIGLSHYLDLNAAWKNDLGEDWDIPRLIREELAQPIVGAACGGTHRMTGFSYAVNKRTRLEGEFDGQWLRAKKFVEAYHDYIFRLQNADGSFSTKWFAGREDWGEIDRRLQTTGHMLEWLVCSLPKDQLDDPRVIKTVNYLIDLLEDGVRVRKKWEIGPRGHAIHALTIYADRRFGDKPGRRDEALAKNLPDTLPADLKLRR